MQLIRNALVGNTQLRSGLKRSDFGYLGDVGSIPTTAQGLTALITNPGAPAAGWSVSSAARFAMGWNGPYFKNDDSGDSILLDGWGNPFIYAPTASPPTLTSLGADRTAGGTGYNQDIVMQLPANTLFSTVFGFIVQNGAQWSGNAQVELNEAGGSGTLVQQEVFVTPSNNGAFSFTNVPMGPRSVTIYLPTKAAPTKTVGPIVFTVDQPYELIQANLLEIGAAPVGPTNIEVPIEMLDYGLSSGILGLFTTFERTRTPLNTNDYDGTVTYSFEIVGSNSALLPEVVTLINSSGTSIASITIPGLNNNLTRYRTTFTPTTGADNYRIQFPITLLVNQVTVTSARIIVDQIGASKTNVYVPLIAASAGSTSNADTVAVDTTSSTTFTQGSSLVYSVWKKEDAYFSLASGTPYNFVASIAGGTFLTGTASAALYNRTTGLAVTGSTVSSTSSSFSLQQAAFADSATNFSDQTEYEVRIATGNALYPASIAKAGLWVKLANIGMGEVYYRSAISYSVTGASGVMAQQRPLINTSLFSNPTVYHEGVASSTSSTGTVLSALDVGTSDSATTGTVVQSLTWGTTKSRQRSSAISWISGDRELEEFTTGLGQTSNISSGTILIQFQY